MMDYAVKATIRRVTASPNRWTFKIPAVRELVERVVGTGKGWVDPFAGRSKYAEWSNDLDPESPAVYHMPAADFARDIVPAGIAGVLFDPPYSYRQISDCYKGIGRHAAMADTNASFYSSVRRPLAEKIRHGGRVIACGWNSTGFGKSNGFVLEEMLIINHPQQHRNDTLVTLERKIG